MNILYIVHRIPYPPNKGEKIRAFHQIQYLSKRHTVHLACLVDERDDLKHVKDLQAYCASVDAVYRDKIVGRLLAAWALFTDKPLSVASFYSRELANRINQRIRDEKLDGIVVYCTSMAEYVRHVSHIPKVIDIVDVDSEKWREYSDYHANPISWVYQLEADRLARYEREGTRTFQHWILASQSEAALFRERITDGPLSVITNGVDLGYFHPNGDDSTHVDQPALVFVGTMDYFPNVDGVGYFCRELLPLIKQRMPNARLYIVGRNPTREVRELGRCPNVIVTGAVADIRPYLSKARVAVAPLRIARGIQNKILEAMAMGVPVVGTTNAFKGIQATIADGVRIVDDPAEFARAVHELVGDPEMRGRCALQARGYVERHHRWQDHGARLEALLEDATGKGGRGKGTLVNESESRRTLAGGRWSSTIV